MTQQVVISKGASGDISKLAAGSRRADVALGALKEEQLNPSQVLALQALLARYTAQIQSPGLSAATASYKDIRKRFRPHNAIAFTVKQAARVKLDKLLESLLGKNDAAILMSGWGNRINFAENAPLTSEVALFIDSNKKARNRSYAVKGARTTQEEDFKAAGLEFAEDRAATIICATAIKRARVAGLDLSGPSWSWFKRKEALARLTEHEISLLTKLRDGVVRSRSGALSIKLGRLRAHDFNGSGDASYWALGSRSRWA